MQKFDIPSITPAAETPSKRKFSMMEAKPAPREVPAKETPSVRRPSLRLVKPEAEEAKRVASIRKSVAGTEYRPLNDVDKLRAKIKSLRGRIETKIGHRVTGTAKEIQANLSFGESVKARVGSWLGKIAGKKTESSDLNDLLNQLNLAEKTLDVRLTPDVSVAERAYAPKKPRTLRTIKSRLEEIEAKQTAETERALENLHVEVVEPEAPKENIASRIERAKAGLKRAEIKPSPLAESIRMPEEEVEIPVHFEEAEEPEQIAPITDLFEKEVDEALADTDILQPWTLLYEFRAQAGVRDKLLELSRLIKAEETRADKLTEEITALNRKFKKSPQTRRPKIQEQIDAKVSELYDDSQFLSKQDDLLAEARTRAKKLKEESWGESRHELAEKITKEKFQTGQAKGAEAKFRFDATQRLDDILFYSKRNPDYEYLARLRDNPKISELLDELFRQDIQKKIEGDARLEEEELLRQDLKTKKASKQEFDRSLSAFQKETLDKADQWAAEYETKVDKIAAQAKEMEEEAKLPEAKIIEERAPSEMAPPPPTARERKRRLEVQAALGGKTGPTEEIKYEEGLSQGEKILAAATELLKQKEEIEKAGWLGRILRDHPLVEKHKADPAVARILDDIRHHLEVFNARRDGMVERFKRKPKKVTQEFKEMVIERSEFVNRAINELDAAAQAAENPVARKAKTLRSKEKADAYQGLRQDLFERIRDEKQIEDYIQLAGQRDRYLRENDDIEAALYQIRIDKINKEWNKQGLIGDNEDPSVALSGKSGIGRMGVIGSDLITRRAARGRQTEVLPTGVREKTRSKLEKTAKLETKELQPFNTAWAIEKLGVGAAKRWDLVAPVVLEAKLGATIEREVSDMLKKIENLADSEKNLFSDEYRNLPQMMDIVRHTERFNQSPETAAYIFLRALSPANFSDYLAQDIVEATLNKLDQELVRAEKESAQEKEEKKKKEEQGFSMMRAKPKPGETAASTVKSEAPKAKKARTVRTAGKSKAA